MHVHIHTCIHAVSFFLRLSRANVPYLPTRRCIFLRPRQTGFAIAALGFRCDPFAAVFHGAAHNQVALWIRLAGPAAAETLFERGLDQFTSLFEELEGF